MDAINEENKIAPSRKKEIFDYILSSKLVCGKCKHKMLGESGTSRSGEIHYYYVCLSKRRGKTDCDCKAVKKQVLEDYVINATVAMLRKNSVITKIAETICKEHEKMIKDDSGLQILINKRNDAKKAADNIVKAIEQGIITDFTKDRLTTLQNEVNNLDIEINREMQKTYAHLSVDEVERYLLSKVFENPDDIKTRKLLVNTFIREIIWYGDELVITYNFQEEAIPPRLTKSHTEEVEKQVEEATRSAYSFSLGSYIFRQTAPIKMRERKCSRFFIGTDDQNENREPSIKYRISKNLRRRTVQKMQAGRMTEKRSVFVFSFRIAKAPVIRTTISVS